MAPSASDRLSQQLEFLSEVEKLKLVYRRNRTVDRARYENSAEHSWHVALMALLLAEHAEHAALDLLRVVKLLLIHDLVEIDAGDTWLFDADAGATQDAREAAAARRLFALLPADQAAEYRLLWDEFAGGATPEARFAAAVDGLQPLLNHQMSGAPEDNDTGLSRGDVLRRKEHIGASSQALWRAAQQIIDASTQRGLYREP